MLHVKLNTELGSEEGSAVLDLIGFGVLLQIPILMFATFAVTYQQQALAIESISRHALRSHVLWPEEKTTQLLVNDLVRDFGLDSKKLTWKLQCLPDPNCLEPNTTIEIRVSYGGLSAYAFQKF